MKQFDKDKKRIDNINACERENKKYFRKHRVRDYIPGQAIYNLGDYPNPFSISPTEYDKELIKSLAESGVGLIQVHEEWNDSIRMLGADKFTSHDPQGMREFVDLCHRHGIKIISYISTGYFDERDPDFREEFTRCEYALRGDYFKYRRCWAGSREWRNYLLPRTFSALDEYGFDGIYNDWGYDGLKLYQLKLISEGIDVKKLTVYDMPYDPEIEDLLCTIYSEIKRRGGIYKLHADVNNKPPCKERVYDYLWIGECVNGDEGMGIGKDYDQYIVPCSHGSFTSGADPDAYYARVIPFMQFPLLKMGRPYIPKEIDEALIINPDYTDFKHKRRVIEYMKKNPNGPYVYSHWSSVPPDVQEYPRWERFYKLYQPMVTENSVVYIELSECEAILSPIPERVVASMFVNEERYLAVSNFSDAPYTLDLSSPWRDRESGRVSNSFVIEKGKILFLIKE